MRDRRRRLAREDGAELVEFALVFPLLLLVVLGIVDFGFLFQRYEVLTNAAREGARITVLPGYTNSDVDIRINQYLTAGGLTATPTITHMTPTAVNVGTACVTLEGVTVSYPHTYTFVGGIIGYFTGTPWTSRTLTATAQMRSEGAAIACP